MNEPITQELFAAAIAELMQIPRYASGEALALTYVTVSGKRNAQIIVSITTDADDMHESLWEPTP